MDNMKTPLVNVNTPSPQALNVVERYDGRGDAHAWLNIINGMSRLYNWSDQACLTVASLRLTGVAQTWLQSRHHVDWADFQDSFLKRFGETKEIAIFRLEACFQYPGESQKAFADRYLHDMEKAGRAVDDTTVYSFIKRLQPELRSEEARHRFATIDDDVSYCNYWLVLNAPAAITKPLVRFSDEPYLVGISTTGVKSASSGRIDSSNRPVNGSSGFRRAEKRKGFDDKIQAPDLLPTGRPSETWVTEIQHHLPVLQEATTD